MFPVLGLAVLSAAPVFSVQPVTQRPRVEAAQVKAVTSQVEQTLTASGLPMLASSESTTRLAEKKLTPAKCGGARTCVVGVAAGLGAVVIAVDVGQLRKQVLVRIDAISPEGEELAEAVEVSAASDGLRAALDGALVPFVASLNAKRAPKKSSEPVAVAKTDQGKAADSPVVEGEEKKPSLTPKDKQPAPELVVKNTRQPQVAKWVFAGGAVVTAGVAAGLGVSALTTRGSVEASAYDLDGARATTLTQSQLDARAAQANTMGTAALISALVSAGLTATATVLFIKGEGSDVPGGNGS